MNEQIRWSELAIRVQVPHHYQKNFIRWLLDSLVSEDKGRVISIRDLHLDFPNLIQEVSRTIVISKKGVSRYSSTEKSLLRDVVCYVIFFFFSFV